MNYIKESFDHMQIAVCFFDEQGIIRLINHKMMAINNELCDNGIQTLFEFRRALKSPKNAVLLEESIPLYRFSDGTILKFEETLITNKNDEKYIQITAVDITNLVERQDELRRENKRLAEANAAARRIYESMAEIVREEEILSMKMRVHDDIGHSILAAKRALIDNDDIEVVRKNAVIWENSIALLHHSNNIGDKTDELEYAIKRAEALGVSLIIDSDFPKEEKMRHLFSLAIRECVNNCVRHANGNEVYVKIGHRDKKCTLTITNNGDPPMDEIKEGGGLSSLRDRFERCGGSMKIESRPRFSLEVSLKEMEI